MWLNISFMRHVQYNNIIRDLKKKITKNNSLHETSYKNYLIVALTI